MNKQKKNYSYELQEVLSYMIDVLSNEFPTDVFTPEYLIVSILDIKKCHANMFLDNYLMSNNMDELREIYVSVLKENHNKPIVTQKSKDKVEFDYELNKIMEGSEIESDKLNSTQIGTEHVLLSILNPENNIRIQDVFRTVGIDYELIFSKCKDNKKQNRPSKKTNFINNIGFTENNNPSKPQIIPLKSEVNSQNGELIANSTNIAKYTTNINKLVKNGSADDLVGRESELNQMIKVLARRKKNNVMLVGAGGVGKTSIVFGLAKKIIDGDIPSILDGKEIVMINIMALVSGTHFRGMFEERVKGLFDELKNNSKYILFIDDISTVLKGGNKDKDSDLSGMISDILNEGDTRVIGTCNYKDYRNTVESNPTLSNKFQRIKVEPTSVADTVTILNNNKHYYEEYHHVLFNENAIKRCAELAERYVTDRCLPDSAFDVLDLAGANASLISDSNNEIKDLRMRLAKIQQEKNEVLNNGDFERIDMLTVEENTLKKMINDIKKKAIKDSTNIVEITADDVAQTVSEMTNIPISKLSSNEKQKVASINDEIKKSIVGQDEAIEDICKVIKRNRIGLGGKNKTAGAYLCVGKSGTGKTALAKKIAEILFGDENALIRIDMSEYSEKSSVAKLHGSAPGYIGYEDGGVLTNAIKQRPYSVVLLDEIEKADESIYNLFLQVFDEGRLTESNGNTIDCKNCVFIMTSNVGTKQASEFGGGIGFSNNESANNKAIIEKHIKKVFAPEFLNRLDKIVYFNNLTDDNLKDIVKLEINKFETKLKDIKFNINYDESVVSFIHQEAIKQKENGARPIIRLIQNNIEDTITDLILKNDYEPEYTFSATCSSGHVVIV